jgi:hypothetical protein
MTTLSKSNIVRNLLANIFGLVVQDKPKNITQTDKDYAVTILDGYGLNQTCRYYNITSSDSPAVLALKLVNENPSLASMGSRIWIHDPMLVNNHPHRYRCVMIDGQPRCRLIDPRPR